MAQLVKVGLPKPIEPDHDNERTREARRLRCDGARASNPAALAALAAAWP